MFKNPKIYILNKRLVLSVICDKCDSNDNKILEEDKLMIMVNE